MTKGKICRNRTASAGQPAAHVKNCNFLRDNFNYNRGKVPKRYEKNLIFLRTTDVKNWCAAGSLVLTLNLFSVKEIALILLVLVYRENWFLLQKP